LHEAVFQTPMPDKEDGTVFHTQSKGFMLNGRVLRVRLHKLPSRLLDSMLIPHTRLPRSALSRTHKQHLRLCNCMNKDVGNEWNVHLERSTTDSRTSWLAFGTLV
jgi:hypothetical protein